MSETSHTNPEQVPEFEQIQYPDGGTALQYAAPGQMVGFGRDSKQKYADHFDSPEPVSVAVITTASGNVFGMGARFIVNNDLGSAMHLPEIIPTVTIGKPWELPGYITTPVVSVQLRYKTGPIDPHIRQVQKPNPFPDLVAKLSALRRTHGEVDES